MFTLQYRDIVTRVVYLDQLQGASSSVYFYRLLGASLNTLISIHDKYHYKTCVPQVKIRQTQTEEMEIGTDRQTDRQRKEKIRKKKAESTEIFSVFQSMEFVKMVSSYTTNLSCTSIISFRYMTSSKVVFKLMANVFNKLVHIFIGLFAVCFKAKDIF